MPTASRHAETETASTAPNRHPAARLTSPALNSHRLAPTTLRHGDAAGHEVATIEPADFDAFAAVIRRELAPTTLLEQVLADRVVLATWRLRRISEAETARARDGQGGSELLPITRSVLRAESSLETALTILEAARSSQRPRWGRAAELSTRLHPDVVADAYADDDDDESFDPVDAFDDLPELSNEWASLPEPGTDAPTPADASWRGRLVFDDNVSASSPVVRGTWVTVSQVVSLIVDGWAWSDILRAHPELSEDDVRACLSYSAANDDDTP